MESIALKEVKDDSDLDQGCNWGMGRGSQSDTLSEGRGRGERTAPALEGYKDESEVGMSSRVNSIIICDMGVLGRKRTCPATGVQFGVCPDLRPIRHLS